MVPMGNLVWRWPNPPTPDCHSPVAALQEATIIPAVKLRVVDIVVCLPRPLAGSHKAHFRQPNVFLEKNKGMVSSAAIPEKHDNSSLGHILPRMHWDGRLKGDEISRCSSKVTLRRIQPDKLARGKLVFVADGSHISTKQSGQTRCVCSPNRMVITSSPLGPMYCDLQSTTRTIS